MKQQEEKIKKQEDLRLEAERKMVEMQAQLDEKIQNKVKEKVMEIDDQYKKENDALREQIAMIQGNFQDMKSNLFRNE